jgi:hypothetical protein
MKNFRTISSFLLVFTMLAFTGCGNSPKTETPAIVQPSAEQIVQRGEYLVTIMGCGDCHSPKKAGERGPEVISELLLSGYPADRPLQKVVPETIKKGWVLLNSDLTEAAGPWGVSFSANLTSDQTGIGNWTEENFKRAIKEGKYKGIEGMRSLLPPMPWTNFVNISDDDVKAIFAYLKSTKPVSNLVPVAIAPGDLK